MQMHITLPHCCEISQAHRVSQRASQRCDVNEFNGIGSVSE